MLLRLLNYLRSRRRVNKRKPALKPGSVLEPLESRIAPATLINAHIVTYTDSNGDHVTINSSKPLFSTGNVNTILTFDTGTVNGSNATNQQLQLIDLTSSHGDSISVTVSGTSGKGVNVGAITSDFNIGKVTVQGDLGQISAGYSLSESSSYVGVSSLNVYSLGAQGLGTQATATASLTSMIHGNVGNVTIKGDLAGQLQVLSTISENNGSVHSIKIGENVVGGKFPQYAMDTMPMTNQSLITDGSVGSIAITGNVMGGSVNDSGTLQIGTRLGSLSVNNIMGGSGDGSGSIVTGNEITGGIGTTLIKGNLQGGSGKSSGNIGETNFSGGSFGAITIGGSVIGGSNQYAGEIDANAIGALKIGTGIVGGSGDHAGTIVSNNGIASISIASGGIVGGTADDSGSIIAAAAANNAAKIGTVVIHGNITGDATAASTITGAGQINTGASISSLTLYGSLVGSTSQESGSVLVGEGLGHFSILPNALLTDSSAAGSILGGAGSNSGELSAGSIGTGSVAGQILGMSTGSGKIITSQGIGSLSIGTGIAGGTGDNSGVIITGTSGTTYGNNLGSLTIKDGGIMGNSGNGSGSLQIGGTIGSVHVSGAITGGGGTASGAIVSTDNMGSITVGSIALGTGSESGEISTGGNLSSITLTGAAASTTPTDTGMVVVTGSAGAITVHGNVGDAASTADSAGLFSIGGGVKSFTVTGALEGGGGTDSGAIFAGLDDTSVISLVNIAGGLSGGAGMGSGEVFGGGGISHANVASLHGGGGESSGSIVSDGALGAISINGAAKAGIQGGNGDYSGQILAGTTIGSVKVLGSVTGGVGNGSGSIVSNSAHNSSGDIQGNIGLISISGSVVGGTGMNSGQISSAGDLKTLEIVGSVTGQAVSGTGAILAGTQLTGSTGGDITTLKIGGALTGADIGDGVGTVSGSGYIMAGHIGAATIGSIQAGTAGVADTVTDDGAILAANDIASLTVKGGIAGTSSNRAVISVVGQMTPGKHSDMAIGKISVGSDVAYTDFLAGYDQTGSPANGAASIGAVVVGGDWTASNLVAGVIAGHNVDNMTAYGDASSTLMANSSSLIPTIASVIIKNHVKEDPNMVPADTYGFVAEKIGAFSVSGVKESFTAGVIQNVDPATDGDQDTVAREVGAV